MTISLKAISLHQVVKNEQEELTTRLLPAFDVNPTTEALVMELHRAFAQKAKGYAFFPEESYFQKNLASVLAGDLEFHDFSCVGARRLCTELSKYPFSDEGTVVFAQYQMLATDFILVGMLSSGHALTVENNISLGATDYLDIANMDLAALINVTEFKADKESERHISFVKGRVGRRISDFFLDFLEAEVGLNVKQQNSILMQAVSDFISDSKMDKDDKNSFKKQVRDYCNDQIKTGDEVQIKDLSSELPTNGDGQSFADYTEENGYELLDTFPGDRATVRKLTKYIGAGGGLNITFDSLLLGERVFYDPETDTLTIKGTPPNLRDQLTRNA
ncbi:nucleoid-associated protein YejK [Vibrio mediterranei]